MTPQEALDLLSTLAVFDRREVNAAIARGWAWALPDTPADLVLEAARRAQDAGVYVDIQAVKRELRSLQPRIEADVRSAKARRLIGEEWPAKRPLTPQVAAQLRAVQAAEWAETNDRPEELAPTTGRIAVIGNVGRSVPQ